MTERDGLGARPSGPEFTSWSDGPQIAPVPPAGPTTPARPSPPNPPSDPRPPFDPRPPRNPWPTVLTVLAVLVVGAVVVAGTVLDGRDPGRSTGASAPVQRPAAGPPTGTPYRATPAPSDRMEFVSEGGDGLLIVTASGWTTTGVQPPTYGSYLHVEVQLVCSRGHLAYGPQNFSAFDATGELFDVTGADRWGTPLGEGTISAGESVRGTIAFDLPRGEVTLLLSDDTSTAVTALRIPD